MPNNRLLRFFPHLESDADNGLMIAYVNGKYLPQESASISIFDRGVMYGDGCFETLRIYGGRPAFWEAHLARLTASLAALAIPFRPDSGKLAEVVRTLLSKNQANLPKGKERERPAFLLRIQVTRGQSPRGYSIQNAQNPSLIVSLHPAPHCPRDPIPTWRLITGSQRIDARHPLCRHKTTNQLFSILGKAEADRQNADDVLFLNHKEHVAETSCANIFWFDGHSIGTPPLSAGILPGITRQVVQKICASRNLPCKEENIFESALWAKQAVFLTQSAWEILPVASLNGRKLRSSPIVESLRRDYRRRAEQSPFE